MNQASDENRALIAQYRQILPTLRNILMVVSFLLFKLLPQNFDMHEVIQTMIDALAILDTTAKVALGALIAAMSAYWLSGMRVKHNLSQQRTEHQREIIEGVAQQAEQVHHVFMKYFELIQEYMNATKNRYDWPESRKSELYLVIDELVHSFNELTTAESKLLLLNEKHLYKSLRKFRSKVVFFRRHFYIDKKDLSDREAQDIKREISKLREQFFDALSARYAQV